MTSVDHFRVQQALRDNAIRERIAVGLLIVGLLLPWNLTSGITMGIAGMTSILLITITFISISAVVLSHIGPFAGADDADHTATDRIRLLLNAPYLLVVAGFVVVAVVQSFATGSSVDVPPGLGPGAWVGLGGALLAAQPMVTASTTAPLRTRTVRALAIGSLASAAAAVLFTLYQRTRFVLPDISDGETGTQNSVVVLTALLYAVVAIVPVVIAARWMFRGTLDGWLATTLLAVSVLIAGTLVWVFPVGRDIDAFHGIAQSTSTTGVGYEGYLAWVAAAALVGTGAVTAARRGAPDAWRSAGRKCLVLIAVWCGGTAVLRIADLLTSAVLDLPSPPYNATALMAVDLLVAVLALWLLVNSSARSASRFVLVGLFGVLFVAVVCRLVLGVALVPRVRPLNPGDINDVYGNMLVQQITGTFDVALCVLALILLVVTANLARSRPAASRPPVAQPVPPAIAVPRREFAARDRADGVLAESTQRFAAGTTYGADLRTASGDPRKPGR